MAEKQGEGQVQRYLIYHATSLMKENQLLPTLQLFEQRGMPVVQEHFNIYYRLCQETFSLTEEGDQKVKYTVGQIEEAHTLLSKILIKFSAELVELDPNSNTTKGFQNFSQIAHLLANKPIAREHDLTETYAKLSVALLRYTNHLPVDLAFYDAGEACRDVKWNAYAFVLLNRFADICEVIDDPNSGDIENSDFLTSDIPSPVEVEVPANHNLSEAQREEVSDYLITISTSGSSTKQDLPTRSCHSCNNDTYEAAVKCHSCSTTVPACVVTGFPVLPKDQVSCRNCQRPANRRDWNAWVTKLGTCPWCNARQMPSYT